MKKIFLAAAMAVGVGVMASAATDVSKIRVYINPGHGSWTPDDRPNTLVGHNPYVVENPDTTNFFESNTNLRKGFGLLEKLREKGFQFDPTLNQTGINREIGAARDLSNNLVMSHVKCGPYDGDFHTLNQLKSFRDKNGADRSKLSGADLENYDKWNALINRAERTAYNRNLSEICAEVEANNFDYFISIHSNAATEGTSTNYPLFLYRGYDTPNDDTGVTLTHQTESRKMADMTWAYSMSNTHGQWTAYQNGKNLRGDINFYGSSSTRKNTVTGETIKGYLGALKHPAIGYLAEGYFHTYQPARHRAMNWDVCYIEGYTYARGLVDYLGLEKDSKGEIYAVVRDLHEKYTDTYYKPNPTTDDVYRPLQGAKAELYKGTEKVGEYTTDNNTNGAVVFFGLEPGVYTIKLSHPDYKDATSQEITVKANATVTPSLFMESTSYEAPKEVFVNYPDPLEGNKAILAANEYSMKAAEAEIAEIAGKTVKRMIARNGNLYILAHDTDNNATLIAYNVASKTATPISTEGMGDAAENNMVACSDIQMSADGILLAINKTHTYYDNTQASNDGKSARGKVILYRWENDENGLPTGQPVVMTSSMLSGNYNHAKSGHTFSYSGTIEEGKMTYSAETAGSSRNTRMVTMTILDGDKSSENFFKPAVASFHPSVLGDDYSFTTSVGNEANFVATGSGNITAQEYAYIHTADATHLNAMSDQAAHTANARIGFFKYAGAHYMAAADIEDGKTVGLRLVDLTAGLDNAKVVATTNTAIEAADLAGLATAGESVPVKDAYGNTTDAYINAYMLNNGKLYSFTTQSVEQPQGRNEYAYGITLEEKGEGNYTVNYALTGDVEQAELILTNTADPEDVVVIEMAGTAKGENAHDFDNTELKGANYSAAVRTVSAPISRAGLYSQTKYTVSREGGVRAGIVTITDPEHATFGYTGITLGDANGTYSIAPDGTVAGPFLKGDSRITTKNQSSMFRGAELRGKYVFADWSNAGAGYWIVDPMDASDMTQLLGGARQGTAGSYAVDGKIIGGGSSCVAFVGPDNDVKMFSFLEDYPAGDTPGSQNKIGRYDLGDSWTIVAEPNAMYDHLVGNGLLANQNVEAAKYLDSHVLLAQVRGAGNNASGTPCFVIIDLDGNVVYNSATLGDQLISSTSGIAATHDGKQIAVAQNDVISIFDVDFSNATKPVLTKAFDVAIPTSDWSNLKFDYAGNLHYYARTGTSYNVYSLPASAPEATVPAPSSFIVKGDTSGVGNIDLDDQNANGQTIYYNLNGMRVQGTSLPAGIYIQVKDGKATKTVVK